MSNKSKSKKSIKIKRKPKDNTKVKNAIKIEKNGINFKSKLELFTYENLIKEGICDFKYESETFTLLEPFTYNNDSVEYKKRTLNKIKTNVYDVVTPEIRPITYTPDFTYIKEDKTGWIIETKGFSNDVFPLKWKWFKSYLVKNGYNLKLYMPNNQTNVLKTINLIKKNFK